MTLKRYSKLSSCKCLFLISENVLRKAVPSKASKGGGGSVGVFILIWTSFLEAISSYGGFWGLTLTVMYREQV